MKNEKMKDEVSERLENNKSSEKEELEVIETNETKENDETTEKEIEESIFFGPYNFKPYNFEELQLYDIKIDDKMIGKFIIEKGYFEGIVFEEKADKTEENMIFGITSEDFQFAHMVKISKDNSKENFRYDIYQNRESNTYCSDVSSIHDDKIHFSSSIIICNVCYLKSIGFKYMKDRDINLEIETLRDNIEKFKRNTKFMNIYNNENLSIKVKANDTNKKTLK